jgi:adenosylhomocysteine nucleosidase/5'-methylthioadenosine nucleosidase
LNANGKIEKIVILMAMQDEASSLIETLNLKESSNILASCLPFRLFANLLTSETNESNQATLQVNLITSGLDHRHQVDNIGCEAATLMAYEAIGKIQPDLVISAGTAGGFTAKQATIGKVYASDEHFVFHDRIVPLPGFQESGIGHFPALPITTMVQDLGLASGVISTGSSLEKNDKDHRVIAEHDVVAKEMEAAAIAWVCMLQKTPVFAIKSITNLVDQENQSETEFLANFDYSVKRLTEQMLSIIDYLCGKKLSDL